MLKLRERFSLEIKPTQPDLGHLLRVHDLERDRSLGILLLREIDRPHRAPPERPLNFKSPEPRPDLKHKITLREIVIDNRQFRCVHRLRLSHLQDRQHLPTNLGIRIAHTVEIGIPLSPLQRFRSLCNLSRGQLHAPYIAQQHRD